MSTESSNTASGKPSNPREAQKQLVAQLKTEWKLMWSERFDDKCKAEGVSITDYNSIRVEQGTIIHATKDFKALNFREILEERLIENPDRYIEPQNTVGGWNKFIKTKIKRANEKKSLITREEKSKPSKQQPKKGGRGWLHTA